MSNPLIFLALLLTLNILTNILALTSKIEDLSQAVSQSLRKRSVSKERQNAMGAILWKQININSWHYLICYKHIVRRLSLRC